MLARCLTRTQASISVASTKVTLSVQGLSIYYYHYYYYYYYYYYQYYYHLYTEQDQMSREQATTCSLGLQNISI